MRLLVDTSVWVDHLRRRNARLSELLMAGDVVCHPFVIGEIALGHLARRDEILRLLAALPQVPTARHDEVLAFLEHEELMGRGIGWVDAHLLASARLARIGLWTGDRKLAEIARELGAD
jgi:hypothetical protein